MSKWTLEKILACDEIKFGTLFVYGTDELCLLNSKGTGQISFFKKDINCIQILDNTFSSTISKFKFFLPCGTEILPPKDKKKIKDGFWVRVYPNGFGQVTYKDKEEAMDFGDSAIACEYFEREVEVEE